MKPKARCRHGCRFVQIADELWLCPHASWGRASYYLGAVDDGRRLLERAGGYDKVLERIVRVEDEKKQKRQEARLVAQKRADESVRYR